jgi:dihydrofolate reductase
MRKVIYSMMVSLDGFIEGPDPELDWGVVDEELHRFANEQSREASAFLYGRRIYEVMAGYWSTAATGPSVPDYEVEYARI